MKSLPPIKIKRLTDKKHQFKERYARGQIFSLLNIGTPYPVRDVEVNYIPTVAPEHKGKIDLDPGQPVIHYRLCDVDQWVIEELDGKSGDWIPLNLETLAITEDISFCIRAGRTWSRAHLRSIFMLNNRRGWIVGDGIILFTDNRGGDWYIQSSALRVSASLRGIFFLDSYVGWVVGHGIILHTKDGGVSWTIQMSDNRYALDHVYFKDKRYGWAMKLETETILFTKNGGESWQEETIPPPKSLYDLHTQVVIIEGKEMQAFSQGIEMWAVADHGNIWYSEDEGEHWHPQKLFVFLHEKINIRMRIKTDLDIGFDPDEKNVLETIVPYDTQTPVYVFESQEGISYQLVSYKTILFSEVEDEQHIWSDPVRGNKGRITLNIKKDKLNKDKTFREDIKLFIKAYRTSIPVERDYLERELMVYVQPNPVIPVELLNVPLKYGSPVSLELSKTQLTTKYKVYYYIPMEAPPQGKYLPNSPTWPDISHSRHPQLPDSHYDMALIMEQMGRLEEAIKYLESADRIHEQLFPQNTFYREFYHEKRKEVDTLLNHRTSKHSIVTEAPIPEGFEETGDFNPGLGPDQKLKIDLSQEWKEDALLIIKAEKIKGKGGSVWLDLYPSLRVLPDVVGPVPRWKAPGRIFGDSLDLILSDTQYGVGYRIQHKSIPHKPSPLTTGLHYKTRGIAWTGYSHAFGMRVEEDFTIGSLNRNRDASGTASGNLSKEAVPPYYDQENLFPTHKLSLPFKHIEEENAKLEILAIKAYTGLSASFSLKAPEPIKGYFEVDGISQIVIKEHSGILGADPRTVEAWIKTDEACGTIISWGAKGKGKRWVLRVNPHKLNKHGGQLRLDIGKGHIVGTQKLDDNKWHHVGVIYDPTEDDISLNCVAMFIDGQLDSISQIRNRKVKTSRGQEVLIGTDRRGNFFDGGIAEVRIWNMALSEENIQANKYLRVDGEIDDLVGYWKLNERQGIKAHDSSGYHYHGLVIGGMWCE